MSQASNIRQQNDEIDLGELIRALWARKWLIVGVTAAVTLVAAAYAFTATKYYKTQSVLRPVAMNVLDELNASKVYELTPDEALQRVGSGISSYEYRLAYYRKHQELFGPDAISDDQTFEQGLNQINDSFDILRPDPKKNDGGFPFVGLAYTYPWGVQGAEVVNGLIEYVVQQERIAIAKDVEVIIQNRLAKLEQRMAAERAAYQAGKQAQIAGLEEADELRRAELNDELNALRKQLRTRRDNRIAQLSEAIQIAKSLGIVKPSTPSTLGENTHTPTSGNVIRTEVNNQQFPLYFMGSEALDAERSALQSRRSDDFTEPRVAKIQTELRLLEKNRQIETLKQRDEEDFFIGDYSKWNKEAAALKALNLDLSSLQLVNVDQEAVYPRSALRPNKLLIMIFGLIGGGLVGLIAALIAFMLGRARN